VRKQYATLKDVAQRAGTSTATVSYVLNNSKQRYISEEMRHTVQEAAEALNYIKCGGASSLRGKSRKMIAVLVPQFENQFFTRIVLAIERVFDEFGYILTICNTFEDASREMDILKRLQQQRMDGYIVTPTRDGALNTKQLRQLGVPMVVVDRPLEGVDDYYGVSTWNYRCGRLAADHLLDKGHRNIAFVGWDSGLTHLTERKSAFVDACLERGISREKLVMIDGAFTSDEGYRITEKVLRVHPDVTAIIYGFNIQAKGGIKRLMEENIDIPQDMSIVLIGSPEWATAGRNSFTHVEMGDYELGYKAANLLLEIINREGHVPPTHLVQECTLVEGRSVKER